MCYAYSQPSGNRVDDATTETNSRGYFEGLQLIRVTDGLGRGRSLGLPQKLILTPGPPASSPLADSPFEICRGAIGMDSKPRNAHQVLVVDPPSVTS